MYNLYTNSSIYLTSRTSLLSYNDYSSSFYSNGRCQPCSPSSSRSCCCNCCPSYPTNSSPICNTRVSTILPINPSLLYGLRQSTLIQCPPCKRRSVLTAGFERRCYGAPISDLGWNCSSFSEESFLCRAKERSTSKAEQKFRRKGESGFGSRRVLEERYDIVRRSRVGALEDAESILSLLSEEVHQVASLNVGKKKRVGSKTSSRVEKLLNKKDDNVGHPKSQGRRREGRDSLHPRPVEKDPKAEMETVRVTMRYNEEEDPNRRRYERHDAVKDEGRRSKKSVSSYSSYCTCSEDGDVSDDVELEVKDEDLIDTAKDSSSNRVGVVISQGRNNGSQSHRVGKDQRLDNNGRNYLKVGNAAEWDWRKKSEKKLSEEFAEDTKVRSDSVSFVDQCTSSVVYAGDSAKASSSRMQPKASVLDVNSIDKSRFQVSQQDAMASFGSRYRHEHVNKHSDRGKERISGFSNQFSDKKELAQDTNVRNDSVSFVDQSTSSMAYAGGSGKTSSSRMQSKAVSVDVSSIEKSRSQVFQTDALASFGSRYRHEHVNEFGERDKERVSGSSNQLSGREQFAEDTKVRNDSVYIIDQSTAFTDYAGGSAKASSSRMQSKESVLDVNSIENLRSQVSQKDAKSFGSRYRHDHITEYSGHGKERISSSSNQFSGQEENMSSCDYCQACGQITIDNDRRRSHHDQSARLLNKQEVGSGFKSSDDFRESELRRHKREETTNLHASSVNKSDLEHYQDVQLVDSDQHISASQSSDQQNYFSQIDNFNDESMISSFDASHESRFDKRHEEENSILLQASIEEVHKQQLHQEHTVVAGQINLMRKKQIQTRIPSTIESCVDNTSNTRKHIQKKTSGESSGSIVLYQHAKPQQNAADTSHTQLNESKRGDKGDLSTPGMNYKHRLQYEYEQIHLREKLKTVEDHRLERHERIDDRIKQSEFGYETQIPIEETRLHKEEVSSSLPLAASSSRNRVEDVSDRYGGQILSMPSHRATKRESVRSEPVCEVTRHDSGNRQGQPYQASSSRIRVEEIEEEDDIDSLIRRPASCPTVEVDPGGRYTTQDSGWSSQQSSEAPSSHTRDGEIWEGEYEKTLQMKLLPPPPQMVERDSDDDESANGLTSEDSGGSSRGDPSIYISPGIGTPSALQSEVGGIGTYEEPLDPLYSADVMGSAERMDHMSHKVVGEFVEKARLEASTSLSQTEGKSSEKQEYKQKEENQSGNESSRLKRTGSSHHPSGSRYHNQEPADEMCGITDLSLVEAKDDSTKDTQSADQEGGSTPGLVMRSGRSLWNVLGDIARFRWGNHSENHRGPRKSGVSSGDSAGSEAWFDPESTHESNSRRGTPSRLEEASPSAGQSMLRLAPETASPYSAGFRSSSSSGGIAYGESNVDLTAEERTSEGTTSIDMSLPPVRQLRRSQRRSGVVHEMTEEGEEDAEMRRRKLLRNKQVVTERFDDREEAYRREGDKISPQIPPERRFGRSRGRSGIVHEMTEEGVSGSGQEEQAEQILDSRPEGVSVPEGNDVEMRRRKLLRTEQVVRERFDDWEEAYRRESKQRKVDEIFMREALVEASKAAELWEVPVGAVLVRDGKIVARGHNLVEELRDSTAHAEMICIREASNALRTWRLSEATLYVTLEPCAMCAGAILQARVGSLVYGAPNKLLGADGSWIRLFPGHAEGEGSVEQAGPIHPFHPNMTIRRGILQEECADAMQQFFRLRRKKKGKKAEQSGQNQHSHIKISLHPSRLLQKMQHMFHFMFCL